MSLISCPHCGKQISDTAKNCIHCGKPLNEQPSEPESNKNVRENFNTLTQLEKSEIKEEFYNLYPKYRITQRNTKKFSVLRALRTTSLLIEGVGWVLSTIFEVNEKAILGLLGGVLIFIGLIGYILTSVMIKNISKLNVRDKMLCEKKFWKWVTTAKNMDYTVHFVTAKEREIFNNINVDYEDL